MKNDDNSKLEKIDNKAAVEDKPFKASSRRDVRALAFHFLYLLIFLLLDQLELIFPAVSSSSVWVEGLVWRDLRQFGVQAHFAKRVVGFPQAQIAVKPALIRFVAVEEGSRRANIVFNGIP